MTPDPTVPFVFEFDSSILDDGFGIYTREANSTNQSRFNVLQLTMIPDPPPS